MDLTTLSAAELQAGFRAGQFTPVDAITALEKRIEAVEPQVQAFLSRDFEAARKAAETADISLPLGGVPIGIKDVINVKGESCTAASRMLTGYTSPYDATVITKLRAAGAIPFGRLNMDEFAMGSSTENSAYQVTRNPWDTSRIPGGSSGGSAAAVAALEVPATLGSDTGGSIRQPAALCGCVGLKPSYGRVSRYGLIAFASSLDQIGPFARTTKDCALLLNAIAGRDPRDSTSLDLPTEDFTSQLGRDLKGVKLGIPKEYFVDGMDARVRAKVEEAIRQCEAAGAELVEISLPHTEYAVSVYYIIATAEASANLARFDGVRYGKRADQPKDLMDLYLRSREEGFGSEVKRRIILGTYVLSSGYYDAYYLRAQKVRTLIRRDFEAAYEKVDAIVCPTSPDLAFPIGERTSDPLRMYLADIFTIAANLAGICGISVPCGFVEEGGKQLPVGLQFLGKSLDESRLLGVADAYERLSGWNKQVAPLK
ncbi:aspartyl-tRNA(Asn)/glutamyl-tRNA(Gln) amidotransferase subunit A [Terrimicrobium sacchariphilum]|uniref:Glutamyl-tRNA(Gln) amidotransferase subunit A n=1 Tax=Terrimicrobium sacchariphilum TaxID=690879 RepID=A0A146G7Y2_TERSA|nr:Asp-tRNA(Asn)/Glu-tRNA(Gln) amidotransferase subunit GatA [Terrimicrobium sacchariphilum]GAT33640.1 aspartyl-tRNA(Asn)/glutamyl-tRNA(Gln) amidotransferase subunit A [Terrimicrobium sacchariphilum]